MEDTNLQITKHIPSFPNKPKSAEVHCRTHVFLLHSVPAHPCQRIWVLRATVIKKEERRWRVRKMSEGWVIELCVQNMIACFFVVQQLRIHLRVQAIAHGVAEEPDIT